MARPKKTVEVPGQETKPATDADTGALAGEQTIPTAGAGTDIQATGTAPDPAIAARNALLATINEQGAAIIARFEELGFTDLADQQLTDNTEFLELVKKATTAAPYGHVTNEEGKAQPVAGKPVLTERGWHIPG
ncbi:hypothetical protein GTGU_01431 [Trabulsiella guamensis ATCC 49490]|uniref:Uncharacterized protein n=1 Tax=Trabulsiella guamensis ATCC 49490 TaxID=1005994 RepID=A0A085AE69_9ENTR|nr:hypothetical protein [Trabulsiella guamensis]KFC08514.1 hypothetical protein GTGU_01431 [Trabulsiella guamensis ATCC 49490]